MSERRPGDSQRDPTAATVARLDSLPTIAGLDALLDRIAEGTLIAGRYRILGLLGIGGMGAVYRAHDQLLDLEVALKVLRSEIAADESFLQRFRQELIVARRVTHRHVVRIHDLGEHQGMPFMTMDFIPGRSLRQVLQAEGTLEVSRSVRLVRQVAEALGEAHRQGVVHRDLKPSNVLVDEQGDAYVTDFGVARSLHTPGLTRTGEVLGTPDYLAPEQARGEKVDGRCDLYALGLIWFEALSGDRPFHGGSLIEVLAQHMSGRTRTLKEVGVAVPPAIDAILRRCLASDPEARYPNAAALLADLDDLGRPFRRRWLRRLEAAAAATLLAVALVMLWRQVELVRARDQPAVAVAPPLAPPRQLRHSVLVLPFVAEGGTAEQTWSAEGLHELLSGALQESPQLRVVASNRVAQTVSDLGLGAAPDDRELARLAELLKADRVITGRLQAGDDRVRLVVQLGEVAAGALVSRPLSPQVGAPGELFALTERVGEELRRRLLALPRGGGPRRSPLSADSTALQAYGEGTALASRGESLDAAGALERAVARDPTFTAAWLQLSRVYQRLGRDEEALRAAEQAADHLAGDGGRLALEVAAQVALLRGEPEQAQRALAALVDRFPNDLAARLALAEAFGSQGAYGRAMATLQEVVARDPNDPQSWYLLGRFAIQAGEARRAVDDYLGKALALHLQTGNESGRAEVHNALGVGYENLGLGERAIEQHREAAELRLEIGDRRGWATSQYNLGLLHLGRGEHQQAAASMEAALATYQELGYRPGIARALNSSGALAEEQGRYRAALDRYQQALKERLDLGDEAEQAESYNNVGYVYLLLGQYNDARLYLDRALALYEKHGDQLGAALVLQSRGACELAQGHWREAVKTLHTTLERSRELDMKDVAAVAQGSLGRLFFQEGRHDAGLKSLEEANRVAARLRLPRAQAEFGLGAAEILLELGAVEEASKRLQPVRSWRGKGLGREHEAQLALLDARMAAPPAGDPANAPAFAGAVAAARRSHSPALELEARLFAAAAGGDRGELRSLLAEAQRLGHAALELRAGEAVGRAELAAGGSTAASEVLQKALQRARGVGSWRRSWALHMLLARAYQARGEAERAAAELAFARREAARVVRDAPPTHRARLAAQPELRALTTTG